MTDQTEEFMQWLREQNAPRERKPRKKPYVKPDSVRQLENDCYAFKKQQHPDNPAVCKPTFRDDTANGLTACITTWLRLHGFFAARVNTTGTYNARLGRYIKSGSTRGMADISAVISGRSVQFEVKAGHDRPRPDQLKVQEQVRAAGGEYLFVHSFDDFLTQTEQLTTTAQQ